MKQLYKFLTHFVTACFVVLITINISHSKQYTLKDTQKWLKQWGKYYTIDQLKSIKKLELCGTHDSPLLFRDIKSISTLSSLVELRLNYTNVSNLTPIKDLRKLTKLNLLESKVFDLRPLKDLRNLQHLSLGNTKISDLKPLKNLRNLKELYFWNTKVSKEQLEALKKVLPNCKFIK